MTAHHGADNGFTVIGVGFPSSPMIASSSTPS
jgi:hypothetical protein